MSEDGGRDWARTRTSDATEPPPPRAQAEREAASQRAAGSTPADVTLPPVEQVAPRSSLLVQAGLPALAGVVLAGAAATGTVPLVVAVVAVQALVVVAVLALVDAPALGGAAVVAGAAAAAADLAVLADDGRVDRLAEVVGLALVASLLHQLLRRGRSRVTESLAATSLAVLAAVAAACLLGPSVRDGDERVLPAVLAGAAVALLVGRPADRLLPRAAVAAGTTRTWPGLVLAAVAGTAVVLAVAGGTHDFAGTAPVALACVAAVLLVDLAVDRGAGELRSGSRDARRVAALLPARALLPYALLGPVAVLVLGRLTA